MKSETLLNTLQPCKEIDHQAQHSLQLKMQEKISSPTRPLDWYIPLMGKGSDRGILHLLSPVVHVWRSLIRILEQINWIHILEQINYYVDDFGRPCSLPRVMNIPDQRFWTNKLLCIWFLLSSVVHSVCHLLWRSH